MDNAIALLSDPAAWAALVTLLVMEVVLGIDNLLFISILSNKLPEAERARARQIGIALALVLRLALLGAISWIVSLNQPVFSAFGQEFSWRELILIAGGLFLVWKATNEIRHAVDPDPDDAVVGSGTAAVTLGGTIAQILVLDLVFSIDSILTAVGMTDEIAIMVVAVVTAVTIMLVAATPLANFVGKNPTIVMLALGFLLLIGTVLIAEGFEVKVPKGYIYTAMAFAALVEGLNYAARKRRLRRREHEPDGSTLPKA